MTDVRSLAGREAVITGGGGGIGRAVASLLCEAGVSVHLVGRERERLDEACAGLVAATAHACDVRDAAAVDALRDRVDGADILVNAAGVVHAAHLHELSCEIFEETIATNLTGAFRMCKAMLPGMRARGRGDIVNVGSVAAASGFVTMGAYGASKAGLEALSAVIRTENRAQGIRVVDVVAGATATDMWSGFWPDAPRDRMMAPESVAACVRSALELPRDATIERIVVRPIGGDL